MAQIPQIQLYGTVDDNIRKHAEEVYRRDAERKKAGTSRDEGVWRGLQVWDRSGTRRKRINELLSQPGLIDTYENGKFGALTLDDRLSLGINDDDMAKAVVNENRKIRESQGVGLEAKDLDVDFDSRTTDSDLRKSVAAEKVYKKNSQSLIDQINAINGGGAILEQRRASNNGKRLTVPQLQSALNDASQAWEVDERNVNSPTNALLRAEKKQTQAIQQQNLAATRANNLAQKRLELEKQQSRLNTDTARIQAANEKELAMYKIKAAEIEAQRARQDNLAIRASDAEARQMQMQFEYARLAQQDRQSRQDKKDKALMVLLQGLGNLGAAFTI